MARGRNKVAIDSQFNDKISGPLDRLRDKFDQLGKSKGAQSILQGVGIGAGINAWNMLSGAASKALGWIEGAPAAYRESEVTVNRLTASLRANVPGWNGTTDAIERSIKAREDLAFSDEEIRDSLSRLLPVTHDADAAFRIQAVAMDLARFKSISLSDATDALTRVEAGSYRILKSLGIQLRDGATQAEALAAVMAVAGGQAEQFAETDLGKVETASIKVEDAQEKLGATISKVEAAVLPAAADAFTGLVDGIEGAGYAFGELVGDIYLFTQGTDRATVAAREEAAVTRDLERAEHGLHNENVRVTDSAEEFAAKLADVGAEERRANDAAHALDLGMKNLERTLYGAKITTGDIAQAQLDLDRVLAEGKGLKRGSLDWQAWQGRVAEAQQALFDLQYQQAQSKGSDALLEFLRQQRDSLGKTNAEIGKQIDLYILLAQAQQGGKAIASKSFIAKMQSLRLMQEGGTLSSGQAAIVGEAGPEIAQQVAGRTVITPLGEAGPLRPAAGSPVVIALQLDGRIIAEVVDEHLYYRRAAAPR